jgi:protein TonB
LPPPPPPPRPTPHAPLRIGGNVKAPALLHRVEPVYPEFAARAKVEGIVILEAQVNTDGQVVDVRVLRSAGLLDQFAVDAVRQWRYSPILLNGQPAPFVLTVTISFSLKRPGGSSSGER